MIMVMETIEIGGDNLSNDDGDEANKDSDNEDNGEDEATYSFGNMQCIWNLCDATLDDEIGLTGDALEHLQNPL